MQRATVGLVVMLHAVNVNKDCTVGLGGVGGARLREVDERLGNEPRVPSLWPSWSVLEVGGDLSV
jgi:hypothetical protein